MAYKPVYLSFYLGNKRLGGNYVKEGSESKDRIESARQKGILYYTKVVFEGRKVWFYDKSKPKREGYLHMINIDFKKK